MPPKRDLVHSPMAADTLPRFAKAPLDEHVRLSDRALAPGVQADLETILVERETLEEELAAVDSKVYDLESTFLKQCVELGGSLFDGYGLERPSLWHRSMARSTNEVGSPLAAPAVAVAVGSPTAGPASVVAAASSPVTQEQSGFAFHARLHSFAPSERVFSSSSVGALGRVEKARAMGAQHGGAARRARAMLAAAASDGTAKADSRGGGRNHSRASGSEMGSSDLLHGGRPTRRHRSEAW